MVGCVVFLTGITTEEKLNSIKLWVAVLVALLLAGCGGGGGAGGGGADAPTGVVVVAGATVGTTASVSFTAPVSNGGSAITGYTVTANPGGITATGTSSPIVLSGLTPNTAYTFSVVASNGKGDSVSASASNIGTYNVTTTWYEPDTQPRDSIFIGTFTYDSVNRTVTNLKGILSESMTGSRVAYDPSAGPGNHDTMTWLGLDNVSNAVWGATQSYGGVTYTQAEIQALHETYNIAGSANTGTIGNGGLNNQLIPSWTATDNNPAHLGESLGGTFAITFRNNTTHTCSTMIGGDGWSPQDCADIGGVYYGFPTSATKIANPGNASALIFVPDSLSAANTTSNPLTLNWTDGTYDKNGNMLTPGTGSLGLAHAAYTDFVPTVNPKGSYDFGGGMMGAVGMTGWSKYAYGVVGTMSGVPKSQVITKQP